MKDKSIFVAIKSASTLDGKIATSNGNSKWITSEKARDEVQKIRNRYDAIMTTSSTVEADDPSMTCRLENGKKLTKIILDRNLRTNFNSKIYNTTGEKIYVVVDEKISENQLKLVPNHVNLIKVSVKNSKLDLKILFEKLFGLGIMSVLVESGGKLNGDIVSQGLADKIYQFIAPKILCDKTAINSYNGSPKKSIDEAKSFEIESVKAFPPDVLLVLKK